MNPNGSTTTSDRLAFPDPVNPKSPAQIELFPAPDPHPWVYVEQPVQDVLRLARPVETRWPVGGVL